MTFFLNLTLIFITLKLTGFIGWGWFFVLLPYFFNAIIIIICPNRFLSEKQLWIKGAYCKKCGGGS